MTRRLRAAGWDARGDLIWKWLLRLTALGAFFYVLIGLHGEVPLGTYVLIGGMAGLPSVLSLQSLLNQKDEEE